MDGARSPADRLFRAFAASGDPRALGEVYDLVAPELLRVALHATRDAAEAEDVLQATFVAAIERAGSFDRTQRVLPWLVGILANEARKARERAARRPEPGRLERAAPEDPGLEAERAELLAQLDSALERVPAAFRPVLALRLRHGLSVPEIAAALERPSGTVRSQLARGTEILRRTLPAGLAGALVLAATPTRGLAAVRAAVVQHAALLHGSVTVASVLGGILAVKKWIAAVVLLLGGVWLWSATRGGSAPADVAGRAAAPPVALREVAEPSRAEPAPVEREEARREAAPPAPAPEPRPARGNALLVHARWPDGAPAAGELVLLTPPDGRPDDPLVLVTGADGAARLEPAKQGQWYVRLQRGREDGVLVRAGQVAELTLAIFAGVTVDGRVVDGRGEPVAGAAIWLSERYRSDLGHVVATSDAAGAFTLRCVGPDHWLGAYERGFAPSDLCAPRGAAGDRVELVLRLDAAGGTLRGEVRGADGELLAGALVLAGAEVPASKRTADGTFAPAAPPQRAHTGADGRFELASVALGLQPLQVRAAGHAPLLTTSEVLQGDNECHLELEREAEVSGRVLGPDGRPLASTWIHTGAPERFAEAATWSGLDGRFVLGGLPGGRITLVAQHEQHGRAERELELRPGAKAEWEVVLAPSPRIAGQVLDARGEPLAGMVVVALHDEDRAQRTRSSTTGADGRFVLSGLEPRAYLVWVQPTHGWRAFPLLELHDVWPDGPALALQVPDEAEGATITAEVAASDGTPLVGAELHVWHVERRLWRSFTSAGEHAAVVAAGVPPGTVALELRHPEHPWLRLGEHRLAPGATLDLGRLAFEPAGRLRVRLSGLPEERQGALTALLFDTTDHESGVARITANELTSSPLAAGRHTLVLSGDGVRQVRRQLAIEADHETAFPLVLEPCGVRTVVFELPADAPRPRWIACSLLDERGTLIWGGHADCSLTPPRVRVSAPPGAYTLMAGGEGELTGQIGLALTNLRDDAPALVLSLARNP